MASGKSLTLRSMTFKPVEPLPHPTPGRDRSLPGKARRRAARAARRLQRAA